MTLLNGVQNLSTDTFNHAVAICVLNEQANCGDSTKARALFALQLVVSLVALPILLLLGTISLAVRACQGEGKEAAKELWSCLKHHVGVVIPTSFVGIVAPLKTTENVVKSLLKCTTSVTKEEEEMTEEEFFLEAPQICRILKAIAEREISLASAEEREFRRA